MRNSSARSASHSQTITTRQPSLVKTRLLDLSLLALPPSFVIQNLRLFVGVVQFLQPRCRCQKQPWTKMTVLCLAITISGRPGSFFPCSRNRYPMRCSRLLTTLSGVVSLPRMRDMFHERRALVRRSLFTGWSLTARARRREGLLARLPCPRHAAGCSLVGFPHFFARPLSPVRSR